VYGPDGIKVCEATDPSTAEIASCPLTSNGIYLILAFDDSGMLTGNYNLYLRNLVHHIYLPLILKYTNSGAVSYTYRWC